LGKQKKIESEKLKLKFVAFLSNWSLYTWLTGWHVHNTTCRTTPQHH